MRCWRYVIQTVLLFVLLLGCKDAFDVQPPQVEILSPPDGSQVVGDVEIIVRATDANLSKVLVYMDDQFIHESAEDSFGFTYTVPDSNKHTLKARATDSRGNWGTANIMVNPVAELQITSTPSGAKVWLDWQETGDTTNCVLSDVKPGLHTVKLTKPGYFDWEDTVTAVYKQRANVGAILVADIGAILVTSTPTGAAVWIDGQSSGYTTNCVVPNVPTGSRIVRLTKTDYYNWEDTVLVALGDTAILDATLTYNQYPNTVIDSIVFSNNSYPRALAWNATNNRLYCALNGDDQVVVINCTNNQIVGTVGVGSEPAALVWNETSNRVYCANRASDNVTVIDGASGTYVTTIPVGDYPVALAWNGTNNKVYCANQTGNSISVIDGATNQVLSSVTANYPYSLAWTETGNRLYCGDYYGLSIVDGSSDQILSTISGVGSSGMAWDEIDNRLYCGSGGEVSVIDCASNSVITTIGGLDYSLSALVWNSANDKVYCAHSESGYDVEVIDCFTNSVVDRMSGVCGYTHDLAYNSLQNRVYMTWYFAGGDKVKVIGAR